MKNEYTYLATSKVKSETCHIIIKTALLAKILHTLHYELS